MCSPVITVQSVEELRLSAGGKLGARKAGRNVKPGASSKHEGPGNTPSESVRTFFLLLVSDSAAQMGSIVEGASSRSMLGTAYILKEQGYMIPLSQAKHVLLKAVVLFASIFTGADSIAFRMK